MERAAWIVRRWKRIECRSWPSPRSSSGTALGLVLGYNIISDSAKQPNWDTVTLAVPWLNLAATFLVVYAVALLTTLASALRASPVQPAEALRYG